MNQTKKLSLTFRVDDGVLDHNNRVFLPKNVDPSRTCDNITYKCENLREKYHELFDAALEEYNSKKRSNERIADYYEHIKNGKQEKPFSEVIVQFGDMESCGLKSVNWELAKEMLDEYMRSFEERNKNMKVFNAVLHLDEATPHLHIDFVPICTNQTRGLSTRVSLKRALAEQGISASSHKKTEWAVWKDVEFECMTDILRRHGFERDIKNVRREHLSVDDYKEYAEKKAIIEDAHKQINALKKKSLTELTTADFELLNNQNDFLREKITEKEQQLEELQGKLNAKFVPVEIFSEDKLQFVAAELDKINMPFVEENTTLHVPEYAREQALAFAKSYRKENTLGIRDRVKLDIDRLVYTSRDINELLEHLKVRGYEIKQGKHLAVKPPFGERFVRLKTLGIEYLPQNLEKRIAIRNNFTNSVKTKFETANALEKPFHITIMNTVIAVKEYRLIPRKTDKSQIYTFSNDAEIDHLAKQLVTIRDFHFTSREDMIAKAEELQAEGTDEAKRQLKRVREVIQTYDKIISSDYIGDLIKAQQTISAPQKHTRK